MSLKKLWDKGISVDTRIHKFTVGNDYIIDHDLLTWDCIASAAQSLMLCSIGVLTQKEDASLRKCLQEVIELNSNKQFAISLEQEDCHTAIENYLVTQVGEAGKKIHTGRSRNDQVLVAMRLYLRNLVIRDLGLLEDLLSALIERYQEIGHIPMPGYTHMQPAMPSSVAMWIHSVIEACLALQQEGLTVLELLNVNPLGAASGFGSSLALDRELTSKLLGFSKPQRNPIYIQNSRGKYEQKYLHWATEIASMIEKFAWDMILYSSKEFAFFSIPQEFTTGSSIMPQKENPDVLELLRGSAAKLRAAEQELLWVRAKLPSHYHRDYQYTKEPVMRSSSVIADIIEVTTLVCERFSVNSTKLSNAMTDELYATYAVYREVKSGKPFRTAYLETAKKIHSGEITRTEYEKDFTPIKEAVSEEFKSALSEFDENKQKLRKWVTIEQKVEQEVFA